MKLFIFVAIQGHDILKFSVRLHLRLHLNLWTQSFCMHDRRLIKFCTYFRYLLLSWFNGTTEVSAQRNTMTSQKGLDIATSFWKVCSVVLLYKLHCT